MMKVITAIGNPELNNKMNEYKEFEIMNKDIQYKEGVLEILELKKDIDLLILSNNIPGEIDFKSLISNIINMKNDLKIIIFLSSKNEDIEQFLNSKKIYQIYFLEEIDYDFFIANFLKIPKKAEEKITDEIKELKELIYQKNNVKIKSSLKRKEKNGRINFRK